MTETSTTLMDALGLGFPTLFLTLAKVVALVGVIAFLADQFFGEETDFDD